VSNIERRILELLGGNNDLLRLPVSRFGTSRCFSVTGTLEYSLDAREQKSGVVLLERQHRVLSHFQYTAVARRTFSLILLRYSMYESLRNCPYHIGA
jgi:hypothetical protein